MSFLDVGHLAKMTLRSHSSLLSELLVQAIRVFFMLRSLSLQLRGEPETQLPLTREEDLIKTDDVLDLSELAALSPQQGAGGHGTQDITLLIHMPLGGSVCNLRFVLSLSCDLEPAVCMSHAGFEEKAPGFSEVSLRVLLSQPAGSLKSICRATGGSSKGEQTPGFLPSL